MRKITLSTMIIIALCFVFSGCEALAGDPNVIDIMDPKKVAGGPDTQMKGKDKDIECSVVAWTIDLKFDDVKKHYVAYFKEKGFSESKHGNNLIFRNDVVECKLLPKDKAARAELRVAKILNGKPMPKEPGALTAGI